MFPPSCPDYPACPRNRKGVYGDADEKRRLFLKMEPKSATDIMAIAASVVEFFACGMSWEGVSPSLASRLFSFLSKRSDVGRNNYIPS